MDAAYWRLLAVVEAKEAKEAERAEWLRKLGAGRVLAPETVDALAAHREVTCKPQ